MGAEGMQFYVQTSSFSFRRLFSYLAAEDHVWHWRTYFNGVSLGVYLFLYSVFYLVKYGPSPFLPFAISIFFCTHAPHSRFAFFSFLNMNHATSVLLYVGYMGLISLTVGMVCGLVSYLSCSAFNRYIFGSIKVD